MGSEPFRRSLVALLLLVSPPAGADARPPVDAARGDALYRRNCAACHGANGDGRGPIARDLEPRPRDLTTGAFAFRSTPSGTPPTDDDLFVTITRGIPGTAMAGWGALPADDRWQLVYAVEAFSDRFQQPRTPVPVSDPPPVTPARVARGEELFQQLQCTLCHGPNGQGDGPSAPSLRDDAGRRVLPANLTDARTLKTGGDPERMVRAIRFGLDGTPMQAFGGLTGDDDAWAIVAYLNTLGAPTAPAAP